MNAEFRNHLSGLVLCWCVTLVAGPRTVSSADFLSTDAVWRGNGFAFSNGVLVLRSREPVLTLRHDATFQTGVEYRLVAEYDWNGPAATRDMDFYIDLYVPGEWDGNEYNFIPPNALRRQGRHRYEVIFDPSDAPRPLCLRIVKSIDADVRIRTLRIESVSRADACLADLKKRLRVVSVPVAVGLWLAVQVALLIIVVYTKYMPRRPGDGPAAWKRGAGREESRKPVILKRGGRWKLCLSVVVAISLLGFLTVGSLLVLRHYRAWKAQKRTFDLLGQEWYTLSGVEGDPDLTILCASAPEELDGEYRLEADIGLSVTDAARHAEVMIDFYGTDYDPPGAEVSIGITNAVSRDVRETYTVTLLRPPSNLLVRVFTRNQCMIEMRKLRLTECFHWWQCFGVGAWRHAHPETVQIIPGDRPWRLNGAKLVDGELVFPGEGLVFLSAVPVRLARNTPYVFEVAFELEGGFSSQDWLWFDLYERGKWNADFQNFIVPRELVCAGRHSWSRPFYSGRIPPTATLRSYKRGNFRARVTHIAARPLTLGVLCRRLLKPSTVVAPAVVWVAFGSVWLIERRRAAKSDTAGLVRGLALTGLVLLMVMTAFNVSEWRAVFVWIQGLQ